MKNVCFILSSSIEYSPYVNNYLELVNTEVTQVTMIQWNRKKKQSAVLNSFEDKKNSGKRNYVDYLAYTNFVKKKLKGKEFDFYVVFSAQMAYFLKSFLRNKSYIIDIRDYHPIMKFKSTRKVLLGAKKVVLSSKGYENVIPEEIKCIINHNINKEKLNSYKATEFISDLSTDKIILSAIGANRDLEENIKLINEVKGSQHIILKFDGDGDVNNSLKYLVQNENINNVFFSGYYNKIDEQSLFEKSNIINSVRNTAQFNNARALPNKLYSAAYFYRPIITNSGSYLAEIVTEFSLGLVIDEYVEIEKKIIDYYKNFDRQAYLIKRNSFLDMVYEENSVFYQAVSDLLN